VKDLSGGQRRRLQLLLILLSEPNVLILDEPTNDLDTDMLAAIEDLLDSWPGTLLVVSHDRYLLERVTDQQYAVMDGAFRHLPGGVEQYLDLRRALEKGAPAGGSTGGSAPAPSGLGGAERRTAEKEVSAIDRRLHKLTQLSAAVHEKMATHDPDDYDGILGLNAKLREHQDEAAGLELRWLELSELLEG
jgi:ATP-binding cassette subfamily F protein uup